MTVTLRSLAPISILELCPNKPGAKALLMKWREETFQAFKDVGVDCVIWPYDSGGCTCSQCKPWGTNGFLILAEPIAEMARRDFPGCKVILSTWFFDHFTSGEYAGLEEKFGKEHPQWVDYILADDFQSSEYGCTPMLEREAVCSVIPATPLRTVSREAYPC